FSGGGSQLGEDRRRSFGLLEQAGFDAPAAGQAHPVLGVPLDVWPGRSEIGKGYEVGELPDKRRRVTASPALPACTGGAWGLLVPGNGGPPAGGRWPGAC